MKLRPFGNTGMNVSEVGLGAWQLANPDWGISDKKEALEIVQRSLEAGCNFFDTAPGYGHGRSEELLGEGLRSVRPDVILCTKFGHTAEGVTDFRTEAIRPSLEESMKRLQTDYLDIVLMHNPPREMMDGRIASQYEEFEKLKTEGLIRAYGVSLDWRAEMELVMQTTKSQAAEVFFNALYQETLPTYPGAQAHGIGLIIKVPLDSGWLSGKYRADHKFEGVRSRWSPEVLARRSDLVEKFAALVPEGTSMAHAALQFVLAQPQVSTVIPGAKTVAQALDNFAAADKQLSPQVVQSMYDLWKQEIEADPLPWQKPMNPVIMELEKLNIVAIIPCHRVEAEIGRVIASLPPYLSHIIFVDDASPDRTAEIVERAAKDDPRFILLCHKKNQGVGGAMITGFRKSLELNADLVVKIDGDGQMDPAHLPKLLSPLVYKQADYTKGNRFRDFQALQKMPALRRFGNMGLGFLTKAATGYWNLFDPTNGFVAIHGRVLAQLPLGRVDKGYYFETSMLAALYLLGAVVKDIPMPARYGTEVSSLSIHRSLFEFSAKLVRTFLRRLILKNLLYDFSMASIYLLAGVPLLLFGLIFGISRWAHYSKLNVPAPTGTVMLPTLSVILAIQFIIAAIEIDLRSVPREPLCQQLP